MNFTSVIHGEVKDVFKMLIRYNKNMSFIVWPPFARYKCRYIFILIDDILLFCSLISSLDTPNTTKWENAVILLIQLPLYFTNQLLDASNFCSLRFSPDSLTIERVAVAAADCSLIAELTSPGS